MYDFQENINKIDCASRRETIYECDSSLQDIVQKWLRKSHTMQNREQFLWFLMFSFWEYSICIWQDNLICSLTK